VDKDADAFRTISEVALELELPQHVLRFWETRFSQIKPLKRSGGRRYYRPRDIELLRAIKYFLYGEGYTIKGVQRLLKEQGAGAAGAMLKLDGGPSSFQPGAAEDSNLSGTAAHDGRMPSAESEMRLPFEDRASRQTRGGLHAGMQQKRLQDVVATLLECRVVLEAARIGDPQRG